MVAIAAFMLQFIGTLIAGIWKLSQLEVRLREAIDASGKEIDERIDEQARHFGESVTALRQKITDVELYVRDNYVRQPAFDKSMEALAKRIEDRIDRLEKDINGGGD